MKSKNYYKNLDVIRVIFCIAILLYHLGFLKGGYLAVCSFFVLSGYLSCISSFNKDKFSLKEYYISRITKIYLPLIIVVFVTIPFVSLFKEINWLNLKPEVTSILFGYNNFWQLNVNLDYFARHINSPFMHLWYVSILLQFELIFPFLFILFKKIGDKLKKWLPSFILIVLATVGCIAFYILSSSNMMATYYNSLIRVFSLLFGLAFGFIYAYYKPLVIDKKYINKIIFYLYLLSLFILFIFVDASSTYYRISMVLATLITCRLIDYGITISNDKLNIFDKIIKSLSSISYEIYLVQYPIIFLFQYIKINYYLKYVLIISILIIISYLLQYILNKKAKFKVLKYILLFITAIPFSIGIYQYIISEDHTEEMKALENQLSQNAKVMQQKQKEYEQKLKDEQANLQKMLKELDDNENGMYEIVRNMAVVGVGDSVMLGAVPNLYNQFPNGYFDAKISRTGYKANEILVNLRNNNMLGSPIIINLGANGDCPDYVKDQIMQTVEGREVFWVNVTNDKDVHVNKHLAEYANKYNNLHIIDWESISAGHYDYFVADGIHLTESGRQAYVKTIYDSIYNVSVEKFKKKREKLLNNYEQSLKEKISFYGNDLLLNAYDIIGLEFNDAKFILNKEYTFDTLKDELIKAINDKSLNYNVVFAFDNNLALSEKEYQELVSLCKDHQIYIVQITENTFSFDGVKTINFYEEIEKHEDYLMPDKVHLTNTGNKALSKIINKNLKQKNI